MSAVALTIAPIFAIILLGAVLRATGFLAREIIGPINRLVFFAAIPAMIFSKLAVTPFDRLFDPQLLILTMIPYPLTVLLALAVGKALGLKTGRLASFSQTSHHGNIGYIGLAVAYYYLGDGGLTTASFLAGFLFLLQNSLSVGILTFFGEQKSAGFRSAAAKVALNPIIITTTLAILYSVSGLGLPMVVNRSLNILAGMALPLALLVIGASLSFDQIRHNLGVASLISLLKLVVLPGFAWAGYTALGLNQADYLAGLILVAMPTGTVSFVMAQQMDGDSDLTAAAISWSTLLSALTLTAWLMLIQ